MNPCEAHLKGTPTYYMSEPCSRENAITYEYFCVLKGLSHPRTAKVERHNGTHTYFTYNLLRY